MDQARDNLSTYLMTLVKAYHVYLVALVGVSALASMCQVCVDYQIKVIIDTMAQQRAVSSGIAWFVVYKFMHHGSYFISRLLDIRYKPRLLEQTVVDIYHKTVEHSLHWFDSHRSGEVSSKIADFQNGLTHVVSHLFRTLTILMTLMISVGFLIRVNGLAACVLLAFILIYTPVIYVLLQRQMKLQEQYVSARQSAIGLVNDAITNMFGIKVIGDLQSEFKAKLLPAIRHWRCWDRQTRLFDALYVDNADTAMIVTMSGVQIVVLAHLYQSNQITAGGFAFVAMMTLKIHTLLDGLLEQVLFNINPSIAQIRSSYAFVNAPTDVQDKPDAQALHHVKGHISYQGVSFAYGEHQRHVLKDFNLTIQAGERVGIVGTSGAGKTTMMKCLLRYFDVTDGAVLIDGIDIREVSQASLRGAISIIPQDITMFHRSIKDNLLLARPDATDAELIRACQKASIHDAIAAMPQGYDTVVGERGVKLSGGQRQRIAIARAILKDAPILILDEATSSLDTPTEALIQASIDEVLQSSCATVMAIAHRLSTLQHMDRILVLDAGRIVETGTHESLLAQPGSMYQRLWRMQGSCDSKPDQ